MLENKTIVQGKLARDPTIPDESSFEAARQRIEGLASRDNIRVALLGSSGSVRGAVAVEKSEYDSHHFGCSVAKLQLALFSWNVGLDERRSILRGFKEAVSGNDIDLVFAASARLYATLGVMIDC